MQKCLRAILLSFVIVVFFSYKTFSYDKKDLVGTWKVVSFSEMEIPKENKTYYIFGENGIFEKLLIIEDYKESQKGYWRINKSTLTIKYPNKEQVVVFNVAIEKDTLILSRLGMTTKLVKVKSASH